MKCTAICLSVLLASVSAAPHFVPKDHVKHEYRDLRISALNIKRSIVNKDVKLPVRIALTQGSLDDGDALLMDISDPTSKNFNNLLTADEVDEMFAPSDHAVSQVKSWLRSSKYIGNRPVTVAPNKQYLSFEAKVSELEGLLHTKYHEYEHSITGESSYGCDSYHLPRYVKQHIDFITPAVSQLKVRTADGPSNKKKTKRDSGPVGPIARPMTPQQLSQIHSHADTENDCAYAVTPDCIRTLYNITDTITTSHPNSIGIYETDYEYYVQPDLDAYFSTFATEIPAGTAPQFNPIDGAPLPSNATYPGTEADLDFETVYPFVYPDEVVFYAVDDYHYQTSGAQPGLFNTFLDALDASYCSYTAFNETGDDPAVDPTYPDPAPGGYTGSLQCGRYTPTHVISISYSADELPELPLNYQRRQCAEFMKLGLRGVTVVVSSGDSGVAPRGSQCYLNNTVFGAQSPINCPYVLSVGSTVLPPGSRTDPTLQEATTSFGSSGGFSNIFPAPAYQKDALDFYFTNYPPPYDYYRTTYNATLGPGRYNRAGRGIPDVSAIGQNYAGFLSQYQGPDDYEPQPYSFDGTSVSAPIVAALLARITSARIDAGKKPLGFVNQVFYQNPQVFTDVVRGNNPGCGTDGFSCVPGWDPVTGLGTPNYGLLKELLVSLP